MVKKALGVLERLHEKLVSERGRGGGAAENALNGIFRLDSRRKEQAMRRLKKKKQEKNRKKRNGSKWLELWMEIHLLERFVYQVRLCCIAGYCVSACVVVSPFLYI